jgi:DNA-binding CsgD family transcriptional regulator
VGAEMLEGLGLTPDLEAVYQGLVMHPEQTVAQIRTRNPHPSNALASALVSSLIELGLVVQLAGRPVRYEAVQPDVAVEALAATRMADLERIRQRVPELMELFIANRALASVDCIELLTSRDRIVQRWAQLERLVTNEVRQFNCPPYLTNPAAVHTDELDRLAEGIDYRIIYTPIVLESEESWADVQIGISAGEQARMLGSLPGKLTLWDASSAHISLATGPDELCVIVVHESPLLDLLSSLFEMTWERAVPLTLSGPESSAAPAPELSDDEQKLVSLLAAGAGDRAVARALGVSESTVQRRIRVLMARLGVQSRFQAGLQLARCFPSTTSVAEAVRERR